MSLYNYAVHIKVVPGDPYDLGCNQLPFASHHRKYSKYVQEIRDSIVVPYVHGFIMPTEEKDPETNACFKQLLLRPHSCKGFSHCMGLSFTTAFFHCDQQECVCGDSYVWPWRLFIAKQACLAARADCLVSSSNKMPVLQDCVGFRQFWLPESVKAGFVHDDLIPLLRGHRRHESDHGLHGSWVRHALQPHASASLTGSQPYGGALWRFSLPWTALWHTLRFAGEIRDSHGKVWLFAQTDSQLSTLKAQLAEDEQYAVTGPGHHEEQLTAEMFLALRRMEVANRLEYMAEARGRPKPGVSHPDAQNDADFEGAQGGDRDSEAAFDEEPALPGGNSGSDSGNEADPSLRYEARWRIRDDEVLNLAHRADDAKMYMTSKYKSCKRDLLTTFMKDHNSRYEVVLRPQGVLAELLGFGSRIDMASVRSTRQHQATLLEQRKAGDQQ